MDKYTAQDIEVLEGLEAVKRRPGMYTDTERPNHLAQEVIDNSLDEALEGHAKNVSITHHHDGSISVLDDGRGIPVDISTEYKIPAVELLFTKLHAGGKFGSGNYKNSGGLHGVGISVVNALSKRVDVNVWRDSKEYHIAFENGALKEALSVKGCKHKTRTGTLVRFKPDPKYFDVESFNIALLAKLLKAKALLCKGVTISLNDEVTGKSEKWQFFNGASEYLLDMLEGYEVFPQETFKGEKSDNDETVEWSIVWAPDADKTIRDSYVNLIPTALDGTHVNGFKQGLVDAVREYCDFRALLPKSIKVTSEDVMKSTSYILSVKLKDPQFAGQTKERLSSRETVRLVSNAIKDSFSLWLNSNAVAATIIVDHIIACATSRTRKSKKVNRKKVTQGPQLPGKLADCSSQDLSLSEIFLVEGDSAGGSAKQARDKDFQAIMPLRGKILNTWEIEPEQILASNEIHDISVALGVEPNSDDLSGLRYGKVCILADADSDGLHIASLLCALFVKHYPSLIENGHIYVAMPPLYRIDAGKQVAYALDDMEMKKIVKAFESERRNIKINVQRFKGLGEMNPNQLRVTTMDPNTRRLLQLKNTDPIDTNRIMDMLLAKKNSSLRREWLEQKGDKAEAI